MMGNNLVLHGNLVHETALCSDWRRKLALKTREVCLFTLGNYMHKKHIKRKLLILFANVANFTRLTMREKEQNYGKRKQISIKSIRLGNSEWSGKIQGGSNMTGTDLCINKPHCAAAVRPWESEATTSTLPPARVRTCSVLSGSC